MGDTYDVMEEHSLIESDEEGDDVDEGPTIFRHRGLADAAPPGETGSWHEERHLAEQLSHPEDVYPLPESLYGDAFCTPVENMPILFSSKAPFSYRCVAGVRLTTTGLILLLNYALQFGILYYFAQYDPSADIPAQIYRMEIALGKVHEGWDAGDTGKFVTKRDVTTGELLFGKKSPLGKYAPSLAKYGAPMVQYAKVFDQPANNRTKPPKEAVLGTKYGMSKYNKDYEKVFCGESKLECSFPDNMCFGKF